MGICHPPAPPAAGGHYIAYCQNVINGQWYEFDDQYVTEVHETLVQNAEAYVLFYRWGPRAPGRGRPTKLRGPPSAGVVEPGRAFGRGGVRVWGAGAAGGIFSRGPGGR